MWRGGSWLGRPRWTAQTYDDNDNDLDSGTFPDRSTTTYVARQATSASLGNAKVRRKPKQRQFTVVPGFFSPS